MQVKEIVVDKNLVSSCGRYCGACGKYLNNQCLGCSKDEKTKKCKIMICTKEKGCYSCAQCKDHSDVFDCNKFNSLFNRFIGLIFRLDRKACISRLKELDREAYAKEMADKKLCSIKK